MKRDPASTSSPRRCWISVGSNIDRERAVRGAVDDLRAIYRKLAISPVYETAAVGFDGDPFYNLVVGIETAQTVGDIRQTLQAIEAAHGRTRGSPRWAARTLDLDLLTWGDGVGMIDGYRLPRAEILKFAFVLAPLADIAPNERHPVDGRPYARLWTDMARGATPMTLVPLALGAQPVRGGAGAV